MKHKKEPNLLNRHQGLYMKPVKGKGWGVFCQKTIRRGQVLEVTPAVLLGQSEVQKLDKTRLVHYAFEINSLPAQVRKTMQVDKPDEAGIVVMGLASFCNHDDKPNAEVLWESVAGRLFFSLVATRGIPAHTEICTTYGDSWFQDPVRRHLKKKKTAKN